MMIQFIGLGIWFLLNVAALSGSVFTILYLWRKGDELIGLGFWALIITLTSWGLMIAVCLTWDRLLA